MMTKPKALEAKQALITLLNNPNISVGISFGRLGYVVKVITQASGITVPNSILGVPVEIELTNKPIPYELL